MPQDEDMLCEECRINFIEIYAPYDIEEGKGKVRILTNGSSLTVENYVKEVFENKGYTVVRGGDLNGFLRFCCGGWSGYIGEDFGGETFVALNKRNRSMCSNEMISQQCDTMIDNAHQMWRLYHQNNPPKLTLASKLYESLKTLEKDERVGLLRMHGESGVPEIDWFVFNKDTRDRQFVEVKSYKDNVRYVQLKFGVRMSRLGKNLFTVVYVLPSNAKTLSGARDKERLTELHLERGAQDLGKLYRIGANKIYQAYKKNKDIDRLAQIDYGVNRNCLLFFLKKTKNICIDMDYDEKELWGGDKYLGMKEYLARLELEWDKLRTIGLLLEENEPDKSKEIEEKVDGETSKDETTTATKETHLCVNCWLLGDCEREKKAKRSREIITDCRDYVPEDRRIG